MLEGVPALLAILGLLFLACLPFAVSYWAVKKIFGGLKTKSKYIKLLIPDGVPVTGNIYAVTRGEAVSGGMRAYAKFEYFDEQGKRYIGEKSRSGESVGDDIALMVLPTEPRVHELASIILAFREKQNS